MSDTIDYSKVISIHGNKLWGISGGQLEYVSQRIEWRTNKNSKFTSKPYQVMVLRFTDHDLQATPKEFRSEDKNLIDKEFYELEFPLFSD